MSKDKSSKKTEKQESTIDASRLKEYEELLKEYEDTLNKLFGTKIKWSKLSLKELQELSEALTSKEFINKICKQKTVSGEVESIIDNIIPPNEQGPIIKVIKRGLKILRKISEAESKS